MRYKGKIKKLNHIVISDPTYEKDVWCRYERKGLKEKDWLIDLDIHPTITPITKELSVNGTEFFLFLYKDKKFGELRQNGTITYLKEIKINEVEIGMDTACVALGVNDKATEIIASQEEWQPECALRTTTDGIFGTVQEGEIEYKGKNDIVFIWISGYLDEDAGYTMDEIVDYLKYQLNITELEKNLEREYIIKQEETIEKIGDITVKFREITKEDPKLLKFFSKDDRFSNISFAGTYLAGIAVRNEQRKAGNLEGKIEKSPYSKEQENLIKEHTKLLLEYEKTEQEIENNIDIEI